MTVAFSGSLDEFFSRLVEENHKSAFLPICLYTRNLTQARQVAKLAEGLTRVGIRAAFVVADELHGYNMQMRGYSAQGAARSVSITGRNILRMVEKILISLEGHSISAWRWADIASRDDFFDLFGKIKKSFSMIAELDRVANEFSSFQGHKTSWTMSDETRSLERLYLLSEIAMSIYMTECRGFCCEIWEGEPDVGGPDPIRFLYNHYDSEIRRWTGHQTLCRALYRLPQYW